jgi:hypothetical protein
VGVLRTFIKNTLSIFPTVHCGLHMYIVATVSTVYSNFSNAFILHKDNHGLLLRVSGML